MEHKNARGKDAPVSQQQLTQFFKKPDAKHQQPTLKQSEVEHKTNADTTTTNTNANAAESEKMATTRSSASKQESGQQANSRGPSSKHQTPKKGQEPLGQDAIADIQKRINQKVMESLDQEALDDSSRKLRPRKVENYRQMLDGDEVTKKTLQDEQLEIRKKKHLDDEDDAIDDEDLEMDDAQIERASDDEEDEEYPIKGSSASKKRLRRVLDEDDDDDEDVEPEVASDDEEEDDEIAVVLEDEDPSADSKKRNQKAKAKTQVKRQKVKREMADHEIAKQEDTVFIDNLPSDETDIRVMLKQVRKHIKDLEKQFFEEEDSEKEEELKRMHTNAKNHDQALAEFRETTNMKQFWCIPLSINVTQFEFQRLAQTQKKMAGRLFDVITIDPPWQLSSANPTRGVAIAYDTLNDKQILDLPFNLIQENGFLFIWVINAKFRLALDLFDRWGYKLVDEIAWVKQTVNGKIAKGHGYYLQHAKETCLIGVKGKVDGLFNSSIESDVIFSQRRGQSQKPEEIYEIAEALVPNGYYLEIFGRRNNLHNGWVTIGNEL